MENMTKLTEIGDYIAGYKELVQTEIRVCSQHNEYPYTSFNFDANRWTSCPKCMTKRIDDESRNDHMRSQKEAKEKYVKKLFAQASINEQFEASAFSNYEADTKDKLKAKKILYNYAKDIKQNLKLHKGMILYGNPGNGKTHLATAVAKVAIDKGYTALFSTCSKMLLQIRGASFGDKWSVIEKYAVPDLLILDDLFLFDENQFTVSDEKRYLNDVINLRYEKKKATFILTNLDEQEIKKTLGSRIVDRLRQNGGEMVHFGWDSYRK